MIVPASPTLANPSRIEALFQASEQAIHRRNDRMFAWLMVVQWIGAILAALCISPTTWKGTQGSIHPHVYAAVVLGGLIASLPIGLALRFPGATVTRCTVAFSQMMMSALLVHISGGRIETHFHVFGSLAFLAFYRDWRVLGIATAVTAIDHQVRGIYWPYSVYGVLDQSPFRWLEHAGWVVFIDFFLFFGMGHGLRESRNAAARQAELEATNLMIEASAEKVRESQEAFERLCATSPVAIFKLDPSGRCVYTNELWGTLTGCSSAESLGLDWRKVIHSDDRHRVLDLVGFARLESMNLAGECRVRDGHGGFRWVSLRIVRRLMTEQAPLREDGFDACREGDIGRERHKAILKERPRA